VALVFFVAAACGLCHPKDSGNAEDLAERVRLFFHLMYLSVGLTLTAIWMIFCLFHWAAAMASADEAKNATVIADMNVLCAGIFYSVILVIAFVPTAVVLQRMIEVAFRTNLNSENGLKYEEWKDVVGLSEMPLSTMKTYVALGAPMIGGLFAALMKSFFG